MGYNMVPTDKYKPHKGDKIIKQDDTWTRYTFPVRPGKRSMRSGRPGTGLYTTQATMIARWTGMPMQENFADGKVKGKSRPGRVKRAGASCSGSVTDLRARAKKYGGEKGKMYHWCANMKSGKKK